MSMLTVLGITAGWAALITALFAPLQVVAVFAGIWLMLLAISMIRN